MGKLQKTNNVIGTVFRALVVLMVILSVYLYARVNDQSSIAATAAHNAITKAEQANDASSKRTCSALFALTQVGKGIHFSPPTATGTAELYVIRLNIALDNVYAATDCKALIGH